MTYILFHPRARNARPKWHVCIYVWKQDASSVSQTGFYINVLRRQSSVLSLSGATKSSSVNKSSVVPSTSPQPSAKRIADDDDNVSESIRSMIWKEPGWMIIVICPIHPPDRNNRKSRTKYAASRMQSTTGLRITRRERSNCPTYGSLLCNDLLLLERFDLPWHVQYALFHTLSVLRQSRLHYKKVLSDNNQ